MSKLQLTKKTDALGRAYLKILADEEKATSHKTQKRETDDPIDLMLDDDESTPKTGPAVRADYAAAAVLVARAIEPIDGLTRRLRRESPVVTIAVRSRDYVDLIAHVLEKCAFGAEASVMDPSEFFARHAGRPVLLIARDGTAKGDKPSIGNGVVAKAIHAQAPVIGIATDPGHHLPGDLLRASEHDLVVPPLDSSAVALVIEAVTGETLTAEIDDSLVAACEASDLALSVRRSFSPNECVDRLRKIVARKSVQVEDGPLLQELSGLGDAKRWGLELAEEMKKYLRGELKWSDVSSHAALIVGPPGVGKNVVAKAIARASNLNFLPTSPSEWNAHHYLSNTLRAIDDVFDRAALVPTLIYIDECDGISDRAKIRGEHQEYWIQIVHRLMERMSSKAPGVVVLAATNRPDAIDPALKRAGRLDRTLTVEKPSLEDLSNIFRFYLRDALSDADLMQFALAGAGSTGADVESWTRRARAKARREGRELREEDLLQTIRGDRNPMPNRLRRSVSIHESGHLVIGLALKLVAVHSLSLSDEGGVARAEIGVENVQTLGDIENIMVMLLAGRAAEEEFFGASETTAGAAGDEHSDLAKASRAAAAIELKLGLGAMGPIYFSDQAAELMMTDRSVVTEMRARLAKCYARARRLVAANRSVIERIAEQLARRGHLGKDEIEKLVGDPRQLTDG